MQILTPLGYINIEDLNIGDQVIAYDINDGHIIYNILEGKELWTLDRYQDEYASDTQIYHEIGSLVYNESGSVMYDCAGSIIYDEEGNILYHQSSSIKLDCDGNPVYDNIPYYETIPGELIKTREQIFEEQHGPFTFYRINDTWDLYKDQSIWANLNVTNASKLQVGDIVYDDDDNDVVITSIQEVTGSQWWRLTISGDHSYIADNLTLHNASRYWVGGGSSTNWNATSNTNWSSTSGGANNASVPTSVDDVFFDGAGASGNTDNNISATTTVLSMNISSAYTAAMSHSAALTVGGPIRLGENYLISGSIASTNNLIFTGLNAAFTSSNRTLPIGLQIAPASTTIQRLSGSLTLLGSLSSSAALHELRPATNVDTDIIYCGGFCSTNGGGNPSFFYTRVVVTTGSISKTSATPGTGATQFRGELIIAPTGSVRLLALSGWGGSGSFSGTNVIRFNTASGTILTGSLDLQAGNQAGQGNILDTRDIDFQTIYASNGCTAFFSSSININDLTTIAGTTTFNVASSNPTASLICKGGLTSNGLTLGTTKFILTSGSWTGTGAVQNNVDISGSIIIGNARYGGTATNVLRHVSGSVTVTPGTTFSIGNAIYDVERITWNNVTFLYSGTTTISSSFIVNGLSRTDSVGGTINAAASNPTASWFAYGGFSHGGTTGNCKLVAAGGTFSSGCSLNTDISGSITIASSYQQQAGILNYISGTVTLPPSVVFQSCVLNVAPITWNNVWLSNTINLSSSLNTAGSASMNNGVTLITASAASSNAILNAGGLLMGNNILTGSALVVLRTGSWTGGATVFNDLNISGSVTISSVRYGGNIFRALRHITGSVTVSPGSTFTVNGSCILDTGNIQWQNVAFANGNNTIPILSSSLYVSGSMSIDNTSGVTFASTVANGPMSWSCGILTTAAIVSSTLTLESGSTYTVRDAMNLNTTRVGSIFAVTSNSATVRSNLILNHGATCNTMANFTRINASQGRPINTWNGTVTDCLNVNSFTDKRIITV